MANGPEVPIEAVLAAFEANAACIQAQLVAAEAARAAEHALALPPGWLYAYTIGKDMCVLPWQGNTEPHWAANSYTNWTAVGAGKVAIGRHTDLGIDKPWFSEDTNFIRMVPRIPSPRFRHQKTGLHLTIALTEDDFTGQRLQPITVKDARTLRERGLLLDPSRLVRDLP